MHFLVAYGQISFHMNYNVLKIINLTLIKYSRYSSQKNSSDDNNYVAFK